MGLALWRARAARCTWRGGRAGRRPPELRCPPSGTLAVRMARCLRAPGLRAAGCGCGARGLVVDFVWFHATCFRARQQLGLPRPRRAGRRGIRSQNDVWGTRFSKYAFCPVLAPMSTVPIRQTVLAGFIRGGRKGWCSCGAEPPWVAPGRAVSPNS